MKLFFKIYDARTGEHLRNFIATIEPTQAAARAAVTAHGFDLDSVTWDTGYFPPRITNRPVSSCIGSSQSTNVQLKQTD